MDVEVLVEGLPDKQADVVRQRTRRLGCWPHDVTVDVEPFDAPAGSVVVVAGTRKGRPHTFTVDRAGNASAA